MSLTSILARVRTAPNHAALNALLFTSPHRPPPAARFICLVPDAPVPEAQLARYLWELAQPRQTTLLLLTQVEDAQQAWRARRRLATLAALARTLHNHVETQLVTTDWLTAVRAYWQPGDLVFCHAEQTWGRWLTPQPLALALITHLQLPVYVLDGYYPHLPRPTPPNWTRTVLFDVTAGALIVVCLLLQMELLTLQPWWLQQALLIGSVVLEYSGLAFWHAYLFEEHSHDDA